MTLNEDFGNSIPIDLSKGVEIINNNDPTFEKSWHDFIQRLPRCSWIYNRSLINYYIESNPNIYKEFSFQEIV